MCSVNNDSVDPCLISDWMSETSDFEERAKIEFPQSMVPLV